ncbi:MULTISPECIES: DUF6264 family protein [unclassified Rathayibacter]|uniref:DUF6264 family protein n=1 Tax=unclassified Rathayibacter TaxID=2609250 RepID=UPI001C6149A1|nr:MULTISPECIES: DUF6264 family protein [unclassified Rathayibacter]
MSEPPLPPPPPARPPVPASPTAGPPAPVGAAASGTAGASGTRVPGSGTPDAPGMAAPTRPPARVWDVVLTIVLILVASAVTLLLSFFGLFFAMASDSCGGSSACDIGLIEGGMVLAAGGVWVPFLAAVVVSIVLLVRRRLAFWVPVAGLAVSFGCTLIGGWMASTGAAG